VRNWYVHFGNSSVPPEHHSRRSDHSCASCSVAVKSISGGEEVGLSVAVVKKSNHV
jgi:hypothetical protein